MSAKFTIRIDDAGMADRMVIKGMRAATEEAVNSTKHILGSSFEERTGKVYPRGGVSHQASAPGQAPAPDTGRLRNSTRGEVFKTAAGAKGEVSVNTEYAAALELGTEKMAARPYLSRLFPEFKERIMAAFRLGASL